MVAIAQIIALANQMVVDGVIDRYAIGRAVGATFYLEPVATLDVDIFVAFRHEPGRLLVSAQPILDYLTALLQFIEAGAIQADRFQSILIQHDLVEPWQEFERTFLKDTK